MLSLVPVSQTEIPKLAALADSIWHEYFPCILTGEQIDYMVDRFQSEHAMREQVAEHGYRYYFIESDGSVIGYTGIVPEGDRLFISKVYLLEGCRGKGIGKRMFGEIDSYARAHGLTEEYLRVNKGNPTVEIYRNSGFSVTDTVTSDIGNGYVMDDYVMTKRL